MSLALPLVVLATHRSIEPWIFRLSFRLSVLFLMLASGYITVLLSYWMPRIPAWTQRLRLVLVVGSTTVLVTAGVGEVMLSLLDSRPYRPRADVGRHQYDPDLGHVFRPNYRQLLQAAEWRQEWRSNAQGVRSDRDFPIHKRDAFRILILGDSFTTGDQVSPQETFPGVIQSLMDSMTSGKVEVINAGVPSYGTVHALRYLTKYGARFEPDIVVLAMTPNDWSENEYPLRVIARDGALVDATATEGELAQWWDAQQWYSLSGLIQRSRIKEALGRMARRGHPGEYPHHRVFAVELDTRGRNQFALTYQYLRQLKTETEALGASLVTVLIPFRQQLRRMPRGFDPSAPGRRLATFARHNRLLFRDLLPAFRNHPSPESLYWQEDLHCTAAGYEVVGREVVRYLIETHAALGPTSATSP